MEYPNIKTDGPTITLKEYSLMGELPISDKSGVIIKTMAHLLASVGCSMQLAKCKRRILQLVLNKYSQKEIVTLNKQLQLDHLKNRVMEIYKVWPRRLALKAHVFCLDASISLRRINLTKSSRAEKARQKMAVNHCLDANIKALATMFMMCWEMVREQAKIWGMGLYLSLIHI